MAYVDANEKQAIVRHVPEGIRAVMLPTGVALVLIGFALRLVIAIVQSFEENAWISSTSFSKGYLAVVGIVLVPIILPRFVAHGVSRRAFTAGSAAVLAGTAALMAVLVTAAFAVEEGIFALAGRSDVLGEVSMFDSPGQFASVLGTSFLLHSAYFAGGWLAGSAYMRFGAHAVVWGGAIGLGVVAVSEHFIGLDYEWNPVTSTSVGRLTIDLPASLGGDITLPYVVGALVVALVTVLAVVGAASATRQAPVK